MTHALRNRPRRRAEGLTLVEILVAMAILAMVSLMVYGAFDQTFRNKRIVEEAQDRNHVVRLALTRMARELSMAYVSVQVNPNLGLVTTRTAFVGSGFSGSSRLDFTAFAHQRLYADAHESDQCEISYFVGRDRDRAGVKNLLRRTQRRIDDDPRRGGLVQILVDNVRELTLHYLDPQTWEWAEEWDTTQAAGQSNRLPAQVKIVLLAEDERGEARRYATSASISMRLALNHATYR